MESPKRVARLVEAKAKMGGILRRVIGSTDVEGNGTAFGVSDVGPFILVEDVHGLEGPNQPPFGMHPHAGLVALSWVPEGDQWCSHSRISGRERVRFDAGQVLVSTAGRGLVHDEVSAGSGRHDLLQIILRMPHHLSEAPPAMKRFDATAISPGVVCAFDPSTIEAAGIDAVGYHVHVDAGTTTELSVDSAHTAGFVYTRNGEVDVGGTLIPAHHVAVLTDDGACLRLTAPSSATEVFVGLGAPIDEPWVKLLGNEGFVVAGDEASARAKMADFERNPLRFGHS